jgi:Protein of unknown function (DUF732)
VIEKMAEAKLALYLGCAVIIAAAVQVPVARADSIDDRYMQLLMDEGIGQRAPRDGLIKLGHIICDDMSHGKNPADDANGLTSPVELSEHNRTLVGAAVGTYCSQYKDRIGG